MKHPAMSLTYEGEKLFLVFGEAKVEVVLPYTAEAVRQSLADCDVRPAIIATAIDFLERLRADFQRPDILAAA
jgi:hypothetical protein